MFIIVLNFVLKIGWISTEGNIIVKGQKWESIVKLKAWQVTGMGDAYGWTTEVRVTCC
jgi:hypothetical protein